MTAQPLAVPPASPAPLWQAFMPGLFVVLWGSGFVVAKLGVQFAEPWSFLLVRFVLTAGVLLPVALAMRAPWPSRWAGAGHIALAGLMLQIGYIGGTYVGIALGISAGISALIVGLQPILTALVVGRWLGEQVTARQWAGLLLGLAGVGLVLWHKLDFGVRDLRGIAWCGIALFGITGSTLYQKRFAPMMDWRSGGAIQYGAAALVTMPLALLLETGGIRWTLEVVVAYVWLVLVLSIFAVSLMSWMFQRGAASRVVGMFYLVPPAAAAGGWLLFGETLGVIGICGMALAALGVALVSRR